MNENVSRCPVCGSVIDYCPGHGEIGDRLGFNILAMHDGGDHSMCNPIGCEAKKKWYVVCEDCGEAFDSIEYANTHLYDGCEGVYRVLPESEGK